MTILDAGAPRDDLASDDFNPEMLTANLTQVLGFLGHDRGKSRAMENIYADSAAF